MTTSFWQKNCHFAMALISCVTIAACDSSGNGQAGNIGGGAGAASSPAALGNDLRSRDAAQCTLNNEDRLVGDGMDAPGRLTVDSPPTGRASGMCASNTDYRFGTGIFDITGVIADTASPAWVNPQQVFNSLHTRVYARAYAIESPCNGQRIMFVSIDTGLMSSALRQAVLDRIAADPQLSSDYDGRNVMLSVTHTHSDPNTGLAGDNGGLAVISKGTFAAIQNAAANLAANPETGAIQFASGELLNTNINRSKPAFLNNPQAERRAFLNARDEEVQVNKRVVQLELYRRDGTVPGLINWFGVHPTVIGPTQSFVSGDVKGTASLGFEKLMGAGAEDGPGPTQEGLTCDDSPDVLAAAAADFEAAQSGSQLEGFPGGFPRDSIPGSILSAAVFCNASAVPTPLGDFSCQAEKPILLPRGGDSVTLQLFRIGQVAVLGVPWEVTTIAARRIKTLMLQELAPAGVDTIVIAGLVNNYSHYLTTREEYATQQYEGASTLYGPWTHAAVSQEALRMARAMRNGTPLDDAPNAGQPSNLSVNDGPVEAPSANGEPGTVITQPPSPVQPVRLPKVTVALTARVRFQGLAGNRSNDQLASLVDQETAVEYGHP